MGINAGFTEKLKEVVRVSDVVSRQVKLTKKGKDHFGCCPFHKEKTASFSVNDDKKFYHCFGCGATGDIITFVERTQNLSFLDAVKHLAHEYHIPLPEDNSSENNRYKILADMNEVAAKWFYRNLHSTSNIAQVDYLKSRGIKVEGIKNFFIGYAPDFKDALIKHLKTSGYSMDEIKHSGLVTILDDGRMIDKFRSRIMFPIANTKGRIIGFGGRAVGAIKPKYLNSPETDLFHKRDVLYNLNRLIKDKKTLSDVYVVEGYVDAISMHFAGIEGVVASLGTAISESQIEQLWKICSNPVICMDGDNAGISAMIRCVSVVLSILRPGFSLSFVQLPKNLDPHDLVQSYSKHAVEEILSRKISLVDVIWRMFVKRADFSTPEKRALLKKEIFDMLKTIQDSNVRDFYYQHFNKKIFEYFNGNKSGRNAVDTGKKIGDLKLMKFSVLEKYALTLMAIVIECPQLLLNEKIYEEFFAIEVDSDYFIQIHQAIGEVVHEIASVDVERYDSDFMLKLGSKLSGKIIEFLSGKDSYFLDKISTKSINNMLTSWDRAMAGYNLELLKLDYLRAVSRMDGDAVEATKIIKGQILQQEEYIKNNF